MKKTATVICAKCAKKNKVFGIRTEKRTQQWYFTWAFAMSQESAKNEGYDKTIVPGNIAIDVTYPGCPYCKTKGFIQCSSCNKISCYDGESKRFTCGFCGASGEVVHEAWNSVTGGGF